MPPSPGTRRVQVTTATTGSSIDPNGYTVTLDGGNAQAIAVNGTGTFDNIAPGPHSVQLSGVEGNCTVLGDEPPHGYSHTRSGCDGGVRHRVRYTSTRYRKRAHHCGYHRQLAPILMVTR